MKFIILVCAGALLVCGRAAVSAAEKADSPARETAPPRKPDPDSPWGIFFTQPHWYRKDTQAAREAARSVRQLGASWARLGLWVDDFGRVTIDNKAGEQTVRADFSRLKSYAKALHDEGISIMGNLSQIPRELSSRPGDDTRGGDAGPMYSRVKPRDYVLWEQLMAQLSRELRDYVDVWEIANEPTNAYWVGTPEELAEKLRHTSRGIRRGNPDAKIAGGGFSGGHSFADRLFQLGLGDDIDILSVHYTDENPDAIDQWQALLRKYHLKIPIWNTEERSEIPLNNLAGGIKRSFKFLHVDIGYEKFRPLVRKDLTALPAGIAFSVGANCIGTGTYIGASDAVPGYRTMFFKRGDEVIGVLSDNSLFELDATEGAGTVTLSVEPLVQGKPLQVTDVSGKSRWLAIDQGKATLPLGEKMLFVNGARKLSIDKTDIPPGRLADRFEAELGRRSSGWSAQGKPGFSNSKLLSIWEASGPTGEGHWVELKFAVPGTGRYEIIFSGNSLTRLKPPRSVSQFTWAIDGGETHVVNAALPRMRGAQDIGEGLYLLGTQDLKAGDHTFRLKLISPRETPDRRYALWFDAIMLRKAGLSRHDAR